MSPVVIPESVAAEDKAPLVECPVKILASMPGILRTSFSHQAMVHGVRFDNTKKQLTISLSQRGCCLFILTQSLHWTQLFVVREAGKIIISQACLDCLARVDARILHPLV